MAEVHINAILGAVLTVRRVFKSRNVEIVTGSYLHDLLLEAEKFGQSVSDIHAPAMDSRRDELAVTLGGKALVVLRLGQSFDQLYRRKIPGLAERLGTLAVMRLGNRQHEIQFMDAAYEIFCAAEFASHDTRPCFIEQKQRSRYRKRVEFLLRYKWPVECKRPGSEDNIIRNLRAAAIKIEERQQSGLICLALEQILPIEGAFIEHENEQALVNSLSLAVSRIWQRQSERAFEIFRAYPKVRAVLFHITYLTYDHESCSIGLPTMRLGLATSGQWLQGDVVNKGLRLLVD